MKRQTSFALALLEFHGGQSSPLYAVGSCMLSDSNKGRKYDPVAHLGHADYEGESGAVRMACYELRGLRKTANYPEAVKPSDERKANALAARLEKLLKK